MRLKVLFLIVFLNFAFAKAQTYEIGPWIGGSNVIGDVGSTQFIAPNDLTFGGIFKWNRSSRHSFRASLLVGNMIGDDNDSDDRSRDLRGYKYDYRLIEASVGIEYTFWDWKLHTGQPQLTPYLYTGITGFQYEEFALNTGNNTLEPFDTSRGMAIPLILGIKTNVLAPHIILAAEVGIRYTFTDNLDGSFPDDGDTGFATRNFGNISNNDWYVFSGISLTYTFGRKPCYCDF